MAQEWVRVCADLLQQQPAEVGTAVAHAHHLRLVLPHLEQHLLLQRPEGCGGRPPASQEVPTPDSIRSRQRQGRLRDDAALHHRGLRADSIGS